MPSDEEIARFKDSIRRAGSVEEVVSLVSGAGFDPRDAFAFAAPVVPVVDAGFVLACLRHSDDGWLPGDWLRNPVISPQYDAQCARYWVSLLTAGVGKHRPCYGADYGLRWLIEHGRFDAVGPHLETLQAYVIRGRNREVSMPRYGAYAVLIAAIGQMGLPATNLVNWLTRLPGEFRTLGLDNDAKTLLLAPDVSEATIARVLQKMGINSNLYPVLAARTSSRRNPVLRERIRVGVALYAGDQTNLDIAELFASDAMDDFESFASQLFRPGFSVQTTHPRIAHMLAANSGGVAARLGAARLESLADSPVAELRAQVQVALATLKSKDIDEPAVTFRR